MMPKEYTLTEQCRHDHLQQAEHDQKPIASSVFFLKEHDDLQINQQPRETDGLDFSAEVRLIPQRDQRHQSMTMLENVRFNRNDPLISVSQTEVPAGDDHHQRQNHVALAHAQKHGSHDGQCGDRDLQQTLKVHVGGARY